MHYQWYTLGIVPAAHKIILSTQGVSTCTRTLTNLPFALAFVVQPSIITIVRNALAKRSSTHHFTLVHFDGKVPTMQPNLSKDSPHSQTTTYHLHSPNSHSGQKQEDTSFLDTFNHLAPRTQAFHLAISYPSTNDPLLPYNSIHLPPATDIPDTMSSHTCE